MKVFQLLTLVFCLSIFSSCDILKEVASAEMDKRLTCIPPAASTFHKSYKIVLDTRHEHDKIDVVKQETDHLKCMSTKQIRDFTDALRHEHHKLEYAKYAYSHSSNPTDYYLNMKSALRHEHDKNELRAYVSRH